MPETDRGVRPPYPRRTAFSGTGPHPTGIGVVGSYVHTDDPTRRPYEGRNASATPIYDALYSEYRRAFRALPGDRTGEEDLAFKGFGTGLHGSGTGLGAVAGGRLSPWPAGLRQHVGGLHARALPPAPRRGL